MYHILFFHSYFDGHLVSVHVLTIINRFAMNVGVHVSFRIMVFSRHMSMSGVAGSYGRSIFDSLRNFHTAFHSGCTSLHSHWQCKRVPFSPHPFQHLLFEEFLIMAIKWIEVVLHCSFDMYFSNNQWLWISVHMPTEISMSCLDKGVFRSSAHFSIGCLFCYCWVVWTVCFGN